MTDDHGDQFGAAADGLREGSLRPGHWVFSAQLTNQGITTCPMLGPLDNRCRRSFVVFSRLLRSGVRDHG